MLPPPINKPYKPYRITVKRKSMLAIVRTIGKDLYRVEAFVMTSNGPQWLPVGETKHENLALELREYVRYHATRRWIARKIKTFEAAQRAAQDND